MGPGGLGPVPGPVSVFRSRVSHAGSNGHSTERLRAGAGRAVVNLKVWSVVNVSRGTSCKNGND